MNDYSVDGEWIHLINGPFKGITYKYGRVQLIEEDDNLLIRFDYELSGGGTLDSEFVQYIGPILSELIEDGILKNSIVYIGGV